MITPPSQVRAVVTTQSDMMLNYSASSPVSCTKPIAAIHDVNGDPAILSIGTDGELFLIHRDPASATGWSQQDLTTGLASGVSVLTVGATQIPSGQFCVVIAVSASPGQTSTPVYLTGWLGNDLASTDWSAFATSGWTLRAPVVPVDPNNLSAGTTPVSGATVERILVGATNSASKPPLIVVSATQQSSDLHWFVNGDAADGSWSWSVYAMPEDADQILDMCVGYMSQGLGTYVLYTLGADTELIFTTANLPGSGQTLPYTHFLTAPAGSRCLAALPDPAAHYTNLYVGGDGVWYFDHSTQPLKTPPGGKSVPIVASGALSNVQQMALAQDAKNVSLWVLDRATQNLSYTTGPQNSDQDSVWTAPLVLQAHVAHIAALRQPDLQANQIVTALTDNTLAYQWQDPTTTLWRSTSVPLTDLVDDPIHKFPSYTSHIHVADAQGASLAGVPVDVTSSQWAYVTINGFAYALGPSAPATVKTDVMGNVTIISQTSSVATPVYQVSRAEGPLVVNPATNAIAKLGQIQTGADLDVTLPDGSQLLPEGTTQGAADLGALCIKNLTAYMSTLPADGAPVSDDGGDAPDQTWGGTIENGQMTPYTGSPTEMLAVLPRELQLAMTGTTELGVVSAIAGITGDVLKFIHTAIKDVQALMFSVVKGMLKLAIKIAGQWIWIALRAIGDVLEAINWVLGLLGITLQEILQWLGFNFGWSEVLKTAAVFNNLTEQTLEMLSATAADVQKLLDAGFKALLTKIDSLGSNPLLPDKVASINVVDTARSAQASSSEGQAGTSFFTNSAGGNFIYYQILHGGILNGPATGAGSGPTTIRDYLENEVLPALGEVSEEVGKAVQTLLTGFQQRTLTIGEVVALVTKTLVEVTTEVLQVIVDGLFTLIETLFSLMKSILFTPIDIPFLTALYKLLTGFDSMTVAGGFTLLAAIPSTILYRIVVGVAPFATTTYGLDTATWQQLFRFADPKTGAPTLMLVAGTSHGDFSDGTLTYSQLGGAISLICGGISEICTEVEVITEGELKFVSVISMISSAINVGATLPIDANLGQEVLGVIPWLLLVVDAFIQLCMFAVPEPEGGGKRPGFIPDSGPLEGRTLAPVEEVVKGGYEVVMGVITLVCDVLSFIAEMIEDEDEDRANDGWKFLQNICVAVTTMANGVAAVFGDENPEISGFALLGGAGAVAVDMIDGLVRCVNAMEDGVLYQPS